MTQFEPEILLDEICAPRAARNATMRKNRALTRDLRPGAPMQTRVDPKGIWRVKSSPERAAGGRKSEV